MKRTTGVAALLLIGVAAAVVITFESPAVATGIAPHARLIASLRSQAPNLVSPVRKITRQPHLEIETAPPEPGFRSIDGSGNNLGNPSMGATNTRLKRIMAPAYGDGVSQMGGSVKPMARVVSNIVVAQAEPISNPLGASDFIWQWGQFLDHDVGLTEGTDPPEPADIPVPAGDAFFDPDGTGTAVMAFNRSIYDTASGTGTDNPRQQMNEITAWIDASQVYGSDALRAAALRANDGTGRLASSAGDK